uniref:Epithelial cell transforming 2 like n=1 Tax=Salvator merianae TaxID=96440 RepID=A0A8D0B0L2_SALMN
MHSDLESSSSSSPWMLFQERVRLISHWFDLWTDKQRKQFLHRILNKCNKSQLMFAEKWIVENIPVMKIDFTTLLPRFLSLYILSFLNPKDLCAAAQVNWHWKFLSEQDCLWMPKCIKFGWFLPYVPGTNEYSAWKQYYIACATNLGYLTPRKAAELYGLHNEPETKNEEEEEKIYEKCLRKVIRKRLALHKQEVLKSRPPWSSGKWSTRSYKSGFPPNLSKTINEQASLSGTMIPLKKRISSFQNKFTKQISEENKSLSGVSWEAEKPLGLTSLKRLSKRYTNAEHSLRAHLVLISSNVSAFEMLVDSVKPGVVSVVYDHSSTTLESLVYYIEKALDGHMAKTVGIICDGDSRGINLVQGYRICTETLLKSEVRQFWEKLRHCVSSQDEGGYIDIFVHLAASEPGLELLSKLSQLTGTFLRTPIGIASGSYQHILSEWLWNQKDGPAPPLLYFTDVKLQLWLKCTEFLEEALKAARETLRPHFCDLQKKVAGKILGQLMFDSMSWSEVQDNKIIAQVLVDGLVELSRGNHQNPLEFLSNFLMNKCNKSEESRNQDLLTKNNSESTFGRSVKSGKLHEDVIENRERFARELLLSEQSYVRTLEMVRNVYVKPLKAALTTNQAILSSISIQVIFTDILNILQLNRWFLDVLTKRLNEWSPSQNLGDLFIKFGEQLQTYTNFFNNYSVILKAIDKCRETIPVFRAFLKRHDRTVVTAMRSLQELLLCPSKRIEEYTTLLYALRLHSSAEHGDQEDLTTAVKQMEQYKDYLDQIRHNVSREDQIRSIQRHIQECPPLLKANRYLIRIQDVAQLECCCERISTPFRLYEHTHDLRLFLFNNILLISRRSISYKPFERIANTAHHFFAAIALHRLFVEDIPNTKYVKNAFLLQGPKCELICSTEEDDKFPWLTDLQRAINCSTEDNVNCS